ncbi:ABC transporter ATP-binding protein [Paenibacillus sp. PR3]|uniref:ABC transporter ATP-binding protein n=1 Tax=Paenibacillus terricola TaxID=2763503 RepID=A0ABR8MNN8_9BACL|nr:ABC transporter ATP-binding protein [Paenibacillus terricola]MBD3917185.1 ABC transporter ATP-binding protein [Paenibacillus terricola]
MSESVLSVSDVHKSINKQQILHGVSLEATKGHVVALCGGNGAGKSTLLRMIAGVSQPTAGSIRVAGQSWKNNRKRYAEQIGYMPDDYLFSHGLSAEETLAFWATLRRVDKEVVGQKLALVGLSEVRRKPVTSFSKGMRQRLLFAQALLGNPALLVMDEPTNGLDPYWMDSFVELVRTVKDAGHTVIFSTHQMQVADAIADEVIFLKEGRIVQSGPVEAYREVGDSLGLYKAFQTLFGYEA